MGKAEGEEVFVLTGGSKTARKSINIKFSRFSLQQREYFHSFDVQNQSLVVYLTRITAHRHVGRLFKTMI